MIELINVEVSKIGFKFKIDKLLVKDNEYFVVLGPIGSGKTTLLNIIAGFEHVFKGRITIDGEDVTHAPPEKRGIAYVFQDPLLIPHMTVAENIALGSKGDYGVVRRVAKILNIEHLLSKYPYELSGGEQQKVAIARALASKPRLILFDEPLSSLDKSNKEAVIRVLLKLKGKVTVIHVTHNLSEAFILADRIAVIHRGKILTVDTPENLIYNPKDEKVAHFLGLVNFFKGEAEIDKDRTIITLSNNVKLHVLGKVKGKVFVSIPPEEIIILNRKEDIIAANKFEGKIVDLIPHDTYVEVRVEVSGILFKTYTSRKAVKNLNLKVGRKIVIAFKKSSVRVQRIKEDKIKEARRK